MTKRNFTILLDNEALPTVTNLLKKECERLIRTGGLDLESFEEDSLAPIKIVLAAAFPAVASQLAPLAPEHKRAAKNLAKF